MPEVIEPPAALARRVEEAGVAVEAAPEAAPPAGRLRRRSHCPPMSTAPALESKRTDRRARTAAAREAGPAGSAPDAARLDAGCAPPPPRRHSRRLAPAAPLPAARASTAGTTEAPMRCRPCRAARERRRWIRQRARAISGQGDEGERLSAAGHLGRRACARLICRAEREDYLDR